MEMIQDNIITRRVLKMMKNNTIKFIQMENKEKKNNSNTRKANDSFFSFLEVAQVKKRSPEHSELCSISTILYKQKVPKKKETRQEK